MYRAYYGNPGCGPVPPLDKDQWPFKAFANLDDAVLWAQALVKRGTAVLAIEGDDGTQVNRHEIALWISQALPA